MAELFHRALWFRAQEMANPGLRSTVCVPICQGSKLHSPGRQS